MNWFRRRALLKQIRELVWPDALELLEPETQMATRPERKSVAMHGIALHAVEVKSLERAMPIATGLCVFGDESGWSF